MNLDRHTATQFDNELNAVREQVLRMGAKVTNQLQLAMNALSEDDVALMDQIIADDLLINDMQSVIDEKCTLIIARRQPAANDLRMAMMVLKATNDLERIGDEAKKIARMGKLLSAREQQHTTRFNQVRHAAKLAQAMLDQSLEAFALLDPSAAVDVSRQDTLVDTEYRHILRYLIALMMEDPRSISSALDILFIAKAIERIGDHAQNIAEYVVYLVKGFDVRHDSPEEIERKINL